MKLSGNKILITGGATGIGLALTEKFLELGNTLLISSRRRDALEAARQAHPEIEIYPCDLSSESGRMGLCDWIRNEHPDVNVLVNNAGIQQWMRLEDPDFYERALAEISINVTAPVHLTSMFLELKSLHTIINVTSGLSFVPLSKVPVYCGTKAFFHSFTLSLRHLLKPRNIEVIELIPPALNTDLGGKGLHDFAPPVAEFIATAFEQLKAGKDEITFGFSEDMHKAGPAEIAAAFARMNP